MSSQGQGELAQEAQEVLAPDGYDEFTGDERVALDGAPVVDTRRCDEPGDVVAVWRQLPASAIAVEQLARDVVETLTASRQRRLDAPELIGPRASAAQTSQSAEPLGYSLSETRIIGLEFADPGGRSLRLRMSDGQTVEVKTRARRQMRSNVEDMADVGPERRRKPAEVMVRPGSRRVLNRVDPTLGLEELVGEVTWMPKSGGACVAVIGHDPDGNAVACGRLSGEDRNETMATQVEGLLALEERCPELVYRYLVLAVDMSGVRSVRADPLVPPRAGKVERDDMVIVDRFADEGWLEHIAFWSPDRIARKTLPALMLFERWSENDLGLWLVTRGGRVEYEDDDLLMQFEAISASKGRTDSVRRLRAGSLRKGPVAGLGHLSSRPYGFCRDQFNQLYEDPDVWPLILQIFELADVGKDGVGLSMSEIAATLASEGASFDHDRLRTILQDPIYATGEWTVKLSGIEIPQKPISLKNAVPLDRFQRVQDWLALRRGYSENTPLGEYLFNYVDCVHAQCQDERGGVKDRQIRIRGYNLLHIKDKTAKLRHNPVTPACCKGKGRSKGRSWSWPREELERAAVLKVREIAAHPEILRQLSLAEEHDISSSSPRLTAREREEIETQIAALEQQREAAADAWVAALNPDEKPDYDDYRRLDQSYTKRINALARRLERDAAFAAAQMSEEGQISQSDRLAAFLEIMSVETPRDARMMALRARLFSIFVSKVVVDDDGKGPIKLVIESSLVPPGSAVEIANPIFVAGDFLDRYEREQRGIKDKEERALERAQIVKTDFESSGSKSVSTIIPLIRTLPSGVELRRMRRRSLSFNGWYRRGDLRYLSGLPGWRAEVVVGAELVIAAAALSAAERALISVIEPGTIVSTTEVLAASEASGIDRRMRKNGLWALGRRGWLAYALADGVGLWTVVEAHTGVFASSSEGRDEAADHADIGPVGEPRSEPSDSAGRGRRRGQHLSRRDRNRAAAIAESLSVTEAAELTGLSALELLLGVQAKELVAFVSQHGEVRFPRWQFDGNGRPRSELAVIITAMEEHALWPSSLQVLLTRRRDYGRQPPLAQLLEQASADASLAALSEILAAIGSAPSSRERRSAKGSTARAERSNRLHEIELQLKTAV